MLQHLDLPAADRDTRKAGRRERIGSAAALPYRHVPSLKLRCVDRFAALVVDGFDDFALFVLYECDFGVDDFPKKLVFGTRENLELRLARELREKPVLFFADSEDAYAIVITANVVVVNLGGNRLGD